MNALPIGPRVMADAEALRRYFADMERCGYDIAYNSCPSLHRDEITGALAGPYTDFATQAQAHGYPACIQIQPSACREESINLSEAQYRLDNEPDRCGEDAFYASFASAAWLNYVKELIRVFVQDFGYSWIVLDEPIYRVDIPGTQDRFHEAFLAEYSNVAYPTERSESSPYLKVQKLKAQICLNFYAELAKYAKAIGAKRVGVVPRTFIPTVTDTPETLNTSCDNGALISIPEFDFVVVNVKPDEIKQGHMRTKDDMQESPELCYTEILSQSVAKPVVAIHSYIGDGHPQEVSEADQSFFQKSVLSSVAAAPSGITIPLYGNCGHPTQHQELLCQVNRLLPRFRHQLTPIAFVFSSSGCRHAEPFTHENVWQHHWAMAKHMQYEEKWPVLTLSADALADHLHRNPQLRILLLEEHSPLSREQCKIVLDWWMKKPGRAIIVIGNGQGFSSETDKPGLQPLPEAFPGLLE